MSEKEPLERVAKAICCPGKDGCVLPDRCHSGRVQHTKRARAAVAAIREPTDAMLAAFDRACDDNRQVLVKTGWRVMIDEILKPDPLPSSTDR